jgi:hypothetical protein
MVRASGREMRNEIGLCEDEASPEVVLDTGLSNSTIAVFHVLHSRLPNTSFLVVRISMRYRAVALIVESTGGH